MKDSPWRDDNPFGKYQRRFDGNDRERIVQRYIAGETCAEIAADLNTSGNTINRILHDAGVRLRPAGRRPGPMRRPT